MEHSMSKLPTRIAIKISLHPDGCWLWTAAVDKVGYGRVRWAGGTAFAHRVVYSLLVADPGDLDIDHLCRVHACVNPDHLEAVSHRENVRRGNGAEAARAQYAGPRHCPSGHLIWGDNLYAHAAKEGYVNKQCRTCRRESDQRCKARRRANAGPTPPPGVTGPYVPR